MSISQLKVKSLIRADHLVIIHDNEVLLDFQNADLVQISK